MRAVVVVLGDLGRSPRMLYHAIALAHDGVTVDLVGYAGSSLPADIAGHSRITTHAVTDGPSPGSDEATRHRFLAAAAWRAMVQAAGLVRLLLWTLPRPDVLLVQNPPGMPALLVAWAVARRRSARFVIDWHNLTSAMLALRLGPRHPLVHVVDWIEGWLGRRADGHLFVSAAMARALATRWAVTGAVFRDQPAERFERLSTPERARVRHDLLVRLECAEPEDHVALVVGPTSWTADEDHQLLLDALARLDAARLPADRVLMLLLTGRGPRRRAFEAAVASRSSTCRVQVRTAWFEAGEYPAVVAAADAGLSLHRSASGLDLPMKIADFLGAGVPVFALDYGPCLGEVLRDDENGLLFRTAEDLAAVLIRVMEADRREPDLLPRLRHAIDAAARVRWTGAWRLQARPVLVPGPEPRP